MPAPRPEAGVVAVISMSMSDQSTVSFADGLRFRETLAWYNDRL